MNILFIHPNFPGQFKFLAPALVSQSHTVVALTMQKTDTMAWQGVKLVTYTASRGTTPNVHPWVSDFETKTVRGEACFKAALKIKEAGFTPDVIIAHHGWGDSLFLREVWPQAKLAIYCEFFYQPQGADVGFDPEFPPKDPGDACRLRLKNLNNLLHFEVADTGISPTRWQARTFPEPFRSKITVVHDGIDTQVVAPNPHVKLTLNGQLNLTRDDEVITFVNRNLEPYRGFHVFMRALPELLRRRPNARVLIIGGSGVSYGARSADGRSWKEIYVSEVKPRMPAQDWERVHFLGNVDYKAFLGVIAVSTVHVYLTYPFVLSWSLLESLAMTCAVVASDTEPVQEVVTHGENGLLVNFFDQAQLVESIIALLKDKALRNRLGRTGRERIIEEYDLNRVCIPKQLKWIDGILNQSAQIQR